MSKTLKSNSFVKEVAKERKSGTTKPMTKITIESAIAKTIRPIVCGSFKILRFIIEKTEARNNNKVANSRKFILI
jgi:hypothetical protein